MFIRFCLVGLMMTSIAVADTSNISDAQRLVSDDAVEKKPVQHNVHIQAPNGQQTRVIILGSPELEYEVEVNIFVKDNPHHQEKCTFTMTKDAEKQIPTCLLDFSDPNQVKKVDLNAEEKEEKQP